MALMDAFDRGFKRWRIDDNKIGRKAPGVFGSDDGSRFRRGKSSGSQP
jgi:hypothetical protein